MAKSKKQFRTEAHGALVFCESTQRHCYWPEHNNRVGVPQQGRWRCFLAGYPLVDDRGDELYLCPPCKTKVLSMWQGALGLSEEQAA